MTLSSNGKITVWTINNSPCPIKIQSFDIGDPGLSLKGASLKLSPYIADHVICYSSEFIASFVYTKQDHNFLMKRNTIDDVFFTPSSPLGTLFSY